MEGEEILNRLKNNEDFVKNILLMAKQEQLLNEIVVWLNTKGLAQECFSKLSRDYSDIIGMKK